MEVAVRNVAERRPGPNGGKAEVLWEETGKSTMRAAGVGVHARREGCAEITSGRSVGPAVGGPSCQDSLASDKHSQGEARGLAHQAVVARKRRECFSSEGPVDTQCSRYSKQGPGDTRGRPAAQGGSYPRRRTAVARGDADHGLSPRCGRKAPRREQSSLRSRTGLGKADR